MTIVLVILHKAHKPLLSPLTKCWQARGYLVRFNYYEGRNVPAIDQLRELASKADMIMMLVPPERSASTLMDGPVIKMGLRKIPVALVPVFSEQAITSFVAASVSVHERTTAGQSITLLSQRLPRYLKVTDKIYQEIKNSSSMLNPIKWTADIVHSGDMLQGINQGAGVCLYMGHGRASGWVGYYGVRASHITQFRNKPSAAVLSLCCWTAGRKNVRTSFCESLMVNGIASSVFGAVRPTLFTDNTRWAVSISEALRKGAATIGELIINAYPVNDKAAAHYRLFGDPTSPLLADENYMEASQKIKTYE